MRLPQHSFKALILFFAIACFGVRAEDKAGQLRERLNKIFYWHLADELKLSAPQEKSMVGIIEDIQAKREKAMQERSQTLEALKKLGKNAGLKQTEPLLNAYQRSLDTLAGLDREEGQRLRTLIGPELLARFYIVRDEVTTRVREALQDSK
jgi:hypothetical protein